MIDNRLDTWIAFAIVPIRETRGCPIHEAIDVFAARHAELRRGQAAYRTDFRVKYLSAITSALAHPHRLQTRHQATDATLPYIRSPPPAVSWGVALI
ncbi:hypothetical protein [Streptomyces sp. NPDC086182]|uniref:hypothetical protein n=1 Tax=Streptomyces sp. NPDC086182 TaxID=3155058 RepID=UPI0034451AC7